ncbi:MAG: DUF4124 domain-containing protein [Rhodocyclaceae bacterium]|nr:DUF4124 domain-containing protein [Rhodocyclaceae bacterium]
MLGPPPVAAEQIYRWTDDRGVTHYSSSPPADRVSKELDLGGAEAAPANNEAARQRVQRDIENANRMTAERRQREAASAARERQLREEARRRIERCGLARQQLGVLSRGGPVYSRDRAGNRVYLDDSERDQAIERARQEVREACVGVPQPAEREAAERAGRSLEQTARCLELRERLSELTRPGSRAAQSEVQQVRDAITRVCGRP